MQTPNIKISFSFPHPAVGVVRESLLEKLGSQCHLKGESRHSQWGGGAESRGPGVKDSG